MFESHWGEQLSTVVDPVPVVMSLQSEECVVVDIGDNVSGEAGEGRVWGMRKIMAFGVLFLLCAAGQAVWVPGAGGEMGEGEMVCVGWENKPRKLGFVYCLNRPSALYHAHLDSGKISEYHL